MHPITLSRRLTPAEVRALRASQGWSQPDLANALGVTRTTITRAEGDRGPVAALISTAIYLLWSLLHARAQADLAAGRTPQHMPPPLPLED